MSDPRTTMNGKPVIEREAKSIINFESGFGHKLLCDDITFNTGDACPFSCTFCYVPAMSHKLLHDLLDDHGMKHEDVVIRRTNAVERMHEQLLAVRDGRGRKAELFKPRDKPVVVYSSTNSDVAANLELVGETVAACMVILENTPWHIRLLSKSNLLPVLARKIPEQFKDRIIYGVSTGTFDDKLAGAFEEGTALVSRRLKSLYWLQDNGYRTFGMICPSLPQRGSQGYREFGHDMHVAIRAEKCEHVWAEVMNVRGESMTRTVAALRGAGYAWEADALSVVTLDKAKWERYARDTFMGHAPFYRAGQLRFLQYVNRANYDWWSCQEAQGAVLLGVAAVREQLPKVGVHDGPVTPETKP